MSRRGLTPSAWRGLTRAERGEILAYEHRREERLARLLAQAREWEGVLGPLAQLMILLSE